MFFKFCVTVFKSIAQFIGEFSLLMEKCVKHVAKHSEPDFFDESKLQNEFANSFKRPFSMSAVFPNTLEMDCDWLDW